MFRRGSLSITRSPAPADCC